MFVLSRTTRTTSKFASKFVSIAALNSVSYPLGFQTSALGISSRITPINHPRKVSTMVEGHHPLIGKPAPTVALISENGSYELNPSSRNSNSPLVIFFYPDVSTYGCSREVCSFRDALQDNFSFKNSAVEVVGISGDSVDKLKEYTKRNNIQYPLLSDSSGEARKAYQVNRGFMGLTEGRVTFFVDQSGTVVDTYDSVLNFNEHQRFVERCLATYMKG